jgi:hypothetical protein
MTKLFLAAGVAALAIAAPAAAEQGKGQGKGKGNKGQAAKVERGGGNKSAVKIERRGGGQKIRVARGNGNAKADRKAFRAERQALKSKDIRRDRDVVRIRDFDDDWDHPGKGRYADGCPPGLSKHAPLCMPHGQYKKSLRGTLLPAAYRNRMLPLGLRDIYRDDDDYLYRLGDGGTLYRVNRRTSLIDSLLPLLGAGLMPGQAFPSVYGNYMVPSPYRAFYPDNDDDYYRFANGYVYEVDRDSGMIEGMIPLLAGGYGMGQMLPMSYSAYNVPYQYRSLYADSDDYMYRYAPGAIYQVDPTTSLITGIASLLTGTGLSVGQPLPMGYSTYNVPLAYRDQYYDTNDAWYRYNNGYIYQVDPTTQLVTSLIRAIV